MNQFLKGQIFHGGDITKLIFEALALRQNESTSC